MKDSTALYLLLVLQAMANLAYASNMFKSYFNDSAFMMRLISGYVHLHLFEALLFC
jgi:hypothetical protein